MTIWTEVYKNSPPQMTALDLGLPLYLLRGIPIRFPFLNLSILQFIPCSTIYCVWNWTQTCMGGKAKDRSQTVLLHTINHSDSSQWAHLIMPNPDYAAQAPTIWYNFLKKLFQIYFLVGREDNVLGKGMTLFSCWANTEHLPNMHCAYPKTLRQKRFVLEQRGWIPVPLE